MLRELALEQSDVRITVEVPGKIHSIDKLCFLLGLLYEFLHIFVKIVGVALFESFEKRTLVLIGLTYFRRTSLVGQRPFLRDRLP